MTQPRPSRVGNYELLEDFESNDASVRILRMAKSAEAIQPHLHHRSTQIYVALEGQACVERDGHPTTIKPYEVLVIAPDTVHSAYAAGETAVVLNISIPPLTGDDQVLVPRL